MSHCIEDNITELSKCEIFVFGSNLQGLHNGGAARTAYKKFGAEWGVGVGRTGQCYAIPTMHGGLKDIKPYVDDFVEYARTHPNNRFLVTRVGCGIAGFTDEEMAPLFKEAWKLPNVNFSNDWLLILDEEEEWVSDSEGGNDIFNALCEEIAVPKAITEEDLKKLCEEYKYIIGIGVFMPVPKIKIRYVLDRDKFEYAEFGDFFMCENGELYVWSYNKESEPYHNQNMVEEIFQDECKKRSGYFRKAIFAGVETPYLDCNRMQLYTGDVVRAWLKGYDGSSPQDFEDEHAMVLALGTLGWNDENREALYACVLDNHFIHPDMCARIERCGTVMYRLDWNQPPIEMAQRCLLFQDIYGTSGLKPEDKLVLAKYTPSFNKEFNKKTCKTNHYNKLGTMQKIGRISSWFIDPNDPNGIRVMRTTHNYLLVTIVDNHKFYAALHDTVEDENYAMALEFGDFELNGMNFNARFEDIKGVTNYTNVSLI